MSPSPSAPPPSPHRDRAHAPGAVRLPTLHLHGMAARSAALHRIFRRIAELGPVQEPVLLEGEPGTGREQLARALHAASPRRHGPFVAVSCAALPGALVETDLFGAGDDACPGGAGGWVGAARGGTLYLDGIAALRPALQRRLVEVLGGRGGRGGRFSLGGSSLGGPLRGGIVAGAGAGAAGGAAGDAVPRLLASVDEPWRDLGVRRLEAELRDWLEGGTAQRPPLRVPPLRRRPEDVEPLAAAFLDRASARDRVPWRLAAEALSVLLRHRWPGNLRELEGALEHACAVARPPRIEAHDLPADLLFEATDLVRPAVLAAEERGGLAAGEGLAGREGVRGRTGAGGSAELPDPASLRHALEVHGWRCREVADSLDLDRAVLWRRLRDLGWVR